MATAQDLVDEIAHLRHLNQTPVHQERAPLPCDRSIYECGFSDWGMGAWRPDPARNVSENWERTKIDGVALTYKSDGKLKETPYGARDKFRVRILRGARAGAVVDVTAVEYVTLRTQATSGCPGYPNAEPVPAKEKLCDPARPANMPSSAAKAAKYAARVLKKDAEDLTFDEVVRVYQAKK